MRLKIGTNFKILVSRSWRNSGKSSAGRWWWLEAEDRLVLLRRWSKYAKMTELNERIQAIMADATAPRHIKRRQMNNGSAFTSKPIPTAIEVRQARREIYDTGISL